VITPNEQVSGSSPLVGSLEYAFSEVVIVVGRLIREGWTRYRWECSPTVDRERSPIGGGSKAPSTLSLKYFGQALFIRDVASLQFPCKLLYAKASITS
jgi:hypothetical protein